MTDVALDVLYPSGFYSFQTPLILDYAAAINGVAPVVPEGESFTYLDLGCGDGFTIVLLAAIHPQGRFIGIDLNPGHVAVGRALAAAAGLTNVRFIEAGFEDWRDLDLPPLHYVGMHGVWAWISEAARAAVLDLAADRLVPGGALYAGYNAYPGWAAIAPLRQFFLDYTRGMGPDALANVTAAMKHLKELRAKGADYFVKNPTAAGVLDDMATKDIRYVAHEIYAPHWSPLPFSTVAAQMRGAGLAFVGSAELPRNVVRTSVKQAFYPLLLKETDRERAELHRDIANNTFFRRDLFRKIAPDGPRGTFADLVADRLFGLKVPLDNVNRVLPVPEGTLPLGEPLHEALFRAVSAGARPLRELVASPEFAARPAAAIADAVQLMSLGFQLAPFLQRSIAPPAPPRDWTIPLPLNRRLLEQPVGTDPFLLLASPIAGTAMPVLRPDALLLLGMADAGPAGAEAWTFQNAERLGTALTRRGVAVKDRAGHTAAFAETMREMGPRLAKWQELGLIAPR